MGSLMAGWDSPVSDPKLVRYKRNRSLTKEEIDAYWRQKKKNEEEHLKAISSSPDNTQESAHEESGTINLQRSRSLPLDNYAKKAFLDLDKETSLKEFINKNGWWTRSNWAFLNEPPVLEGHSNTYVSQFHIADLAAPKSDIDAGISTF